MSNNEPTPNSKSSAAEQYRHSGVDGHEVPVRHFDKTPLEDAPLDIDPRTHEGDITTEHLPEELRVLPSKKRELNIAQRAGIATLALITTGGVIFGATKAAGGGEKGTAENPTRNPSGASSASANPSPDKEPTASSSEAPVDVQPLSASEYETVADALPDLFKLDTEFNNWYIPKHQYTAEDIANRDKILDAMFGPFKADNPELINDMIKSWEQVQDWKDLTQSSIELGYDIPLFERTKTIKDIKEIEPNRFSAILDVSTNGAETGIKNNYPDWDEKVEGYYDIIVDVAEVNGHFYIKDYEGVYHAE